ncbi:MAG: type II secretion system F family protein [Advenella sp.]|nr:type II secretion system F family protein [Advenella sp.]MDD3758523.1 type II secretion system F family protein [Advenella sp.]
MLLLLRPGMQGASLPSGDAHPWMLRLLWPWIDRMGHFVQPFLPWKYRLRVDKELRHAGLERNLTCMNMSALQLLAGLTGTLLMMWVSVRVLSRPLGLSLLLAIVPGLFCGWLPRHWLRLRGRQRQRQILKAFPFMLDMTTLCVESGLNLQGALIQTARLSPEGPLRQALGHALNDMRAGMPRLDALRAMADRTGVQALRQWVTAMAQADALGMGLGPILRAQSDQRRSERFLRAEKLAMEAPVKMLLPLVLCIFPCTFIVIAFPIGMKLLHSGLS